MTKQLDNDPQNDDGALDSNEKPISSMGDVDEAIDRSRCSPNGKKGSKGNPGKRFILRCVLLLFLFQFSFVVFITKSDWFGAYLEWNARITGWVLTVLGEQVTVTNATIHGSIASIRVSEGCDAIQPCGVFAAAVLALPSRWRRKVVGLTLGCGAIVVTNFLRLGSLYYLKGFSPKWFAPAHTQIWPMVFMFIALLFFVLMARSEVRLETER
jgi:exosortase/archaeosortase family protein